MPEETENKRRISNLEEELYLLIAKFLRTGPCNRTAQVLREELEEHQLLPKRTDWLGNEHKRSFSELDTLLSQIADDHLLKICSRIGPILDKELPPTVSGLKSLIGVGHQSLLRTKEDLEKPKVQISNLAARNYGMPLYPSPAVQSSFPPNIAQVLTTRELSGPITSRHAFSPKIYARQQLFRRLLGHLSSVYCVLFDRTGKYIFTGADDLLVKIWSAMDGRLLAALRGHSAEITDMAVNYENTLLAAGSCDKTIRVWCLHTTAPVAVLNGHTGMVTSLQFCPYPKSRDQLLISTGNDGCICFWQWNPQNNVFNPKPLKFTERNKAGAQMLCSSFSPGGLFLATGSTDHNVRVYNIAGLNGPEKILEREVHVDRVDSLQFSNKDCRFISGSKDGTALIWKYERQNWSSIQLKMSAKLPGEVSNEVEDSKLKLRVTMVGWTLDDSNVVTAVSDYSIKVWNSFNGNLCHILKGHEDEVFVLESHPTDPRIFLSSGHDGRIILWDLISGSIIKNHFNLIEGQGHGAVFDCKFSPDGLMFASTDSHGHLCIFGFGSNERYKKVPEEQFFHTDYRPLIRDIHHHVLDEQTQTAPHLLPPPFLVDIDGNPYPPHLQRLVPGRETCNDSQLIPYVAVSAAGESEILEPVRPANEGPSDRPTIDDMIERLQQEQQIRESSENGPQPSSSDSLRSPQSSRRMQTTSDDRNAQDPFSPRTPRSQAGHSRVGLRRTGDVEGVQSVGNWQSRGNQGELPAWMTRVVVKPISSSLSKSYYQKRTDLANYELQFFNRELKKKPLSDPILYDSEKKKSNCERTSGRHRTQEESFSNVSGEEFENQDTMNMMNTSTDTESEQNNEDSPEESSDDSGSGEYSDWIEDAGIAKPKPNIPISKPAATSSRRKRIAARYNHSTEDDESDVDNGEEESSPDQPRASKQRPKKTASQKNVLNGKKLPERFRPPEWLTDVMPHKAPYVPQIGDEIVYFRQGHELYVQAVKRNRIYDIYMRSQPWRKFNLRDQEVARIEDITFENHPPRLCCLKLVLLNPASKQADTFIVKYHDMADVIDFIVLKQNYDQAMFYDWKPGDRFRSAIDKAWWLGTIKSQKPLNPNFPDSMFQCFLVKWDNGEKEHMSPWDFEPIDNERLPDEEGGSVDITPEERQAMMYVPESHEWSKFGREHDCDRISRGLGRIMELSIAESFTCPVDLNLYPSYAIVVEYPMDLGTIKARVQNRFYRRLDAVKFDVKYIAVNAQKFNEPGSRIVKQAKCVVDLCIRFIDSTHCVDPMVIYHEMMEAKQSRSQDSQSELDVLCSESDSDGDQNTPKRLKRKKQNMMQQSSKRVRLGSQKYTSASWKQQGVTLVDSMFQWDDSTPFRYPVNLNEYSDYRNIIDCPMDLSTVREKLNNNHYNSPTDFCKDMRLIFQNSRNYNTNKKSRIYSMTIRLSAMFEEHIRGIVSDWRSAVKYEEKIRNNQYVSSRRKPLPAQEGVNVGASTSRGFPTSLPSSSRGEGSRHPVNKLINSIFSHSPRSSHRESRVSNGTGPKKLKVLKSSPHKRKHVNNSLGSAMTNGGTKKTIIKRKLPEKSPKKRVENISKREPSNTEGSRSDSNVSNPSSSPDTSNDTEWGRKSKRMRKDSETKFIKRLRPRHSTRHNKFSTSSLLSRRKRLGLRACSSSPENQVGSIKKSPGKTTLSPLHTRSRNHLSQNQAPIIHSLRERTQPPKYHSSSESSEMDDSIAQNQKSSETSNCSSSSNTSTRKLRNSNHNKIQEMSNESEDSSEHEEQKHHRFTRNSARDNFEYEERKHRYTRNSARDNFEYEERKHRYTRNSTRDNFEYEEQKHRYTRNSTKENFDYEEQKSQRYTRNSAKDNSDYDEQKPLRFTRNSARDNSDYDEQKPNRFTRNSARENTDHIYSTRISSERKCLTRKSTRDNVRPTRSALRITPEKHDTRQTRNRGQRTVTYEEDTDYDEDSLKNSDSDNTEPVISISSRGRLRNLMNSADGRENDSIEENVFNGDTSLSETEINYSDTSTIVSECVFTEDKLEKENAVPRIKGRLRPRKKTKSCGIKHIFSSYTVRHAENSLSLSGFRGISRGGKYKSMNLCSNTRDKNYRRKAMQGKVTLPDIVENNSLNEKKSVIKGRKRGRKSKARRAVKITNGNTQIAEDANTCQILVHPFTFYDKAQSLQTKLAVKHTSRVLKILKENRTRYQRMSLKKLGLNYRRKAMLCKIVLPILCVKNKFPSSQGSRKSYTRRRRCRKRRYRINRAKNELFQGNSNSSNSLLTESSIDLSNCSRAFITHSRGGWRNQKRTGTNSDVLRNVLFKDQSNVIVKESIAVAESTKPRTSAPQAKGRRRKTRKMNSSILKQKFLKASSGSSNSSLQKTSFDTETTNNSQDSLVQSKYNLKDRRVSCYQESLRSNEQGTWNIKDVDPVQTQYKGEREERYEVGNEYESTAACDSDNSDTLTYCSNTSEETALLYYSDDTEISSDTEYLSTQGSKEASENGDALLQNGETMESVDRIQTRSWRQRNSIYENVDVYCNNAMMCSAGTS